MRQLKHDKRKRSEIAYDECGTTIQPSVNKICFAVACRRKRNFPDAVKERIRHIFSLFHISFLFDCLWRLDVVSRRHFVPFFHKFILILNFLSRFVPYTFLLVTRRWFYISKWTHVSHVWPQKNFVSVENNLNDNVDKTKQNISFGQR